jgi:hypothetical protein
MLVLSETHIRDLGGIITCDFSGIKNVNFVDLTCKMYSEAACEQACAMTF